MNTLFIRLTEGFKQWLQLLGYADSTVDRLPKDITRLFLYLETLDIKDLEHITKQHISDHYHHIKNNKRSPYGTLLKNSTLNGIIRSYHLFNYYLEQTNQGMLPVTIKYELYQTPEKEILTKEEIKALYAACDESFAGIRDRVILTLYYGCGLRSNEGIQLDVDDILLPRNLIYVRKGKQYRERYVPLIPAWQEDIKIYLEQCRSYFITGEHEKAFLLNNAGKRISNNILNKRLQLLKQQTNIEKPLGLHVLRHSIASHLLQQGMAIEDISRFLGHKQITSTQKYTRVPHE